MQFVIKFEFIISHLLKKDGWIGSYQTKTKIILENGIVVGYDC